MAGKNAKTSGKTARSTRNERADFVGYVNLTLTEEDREDYAGWLGEEDVRQEAFLDALDLGYQFSYKFDRDNDAFGCSISNWSTASPDSGVIYTARSSDPQAALWKAVYVWDRKLGRNLNNGAVKGARKDAF